MDTRILVVDDEAPIRYMLRDVIAGPGLDVMVAENAESALAVAERFAPLDLVITDIMMPGRDGIELATQLTARGHARRFLFLSGACNYEAVASRMAAFEDSAFLAKPFGIPNFLRTLRALLPGEPRDGDSSERLLA